MNTQNYQVFWTRLTSFGQSDLISDPHKIKKKKKKKKKNPGVY